MDWNDYHGKILLEIIYRFEEQKIRYFILRNYQGLPSVNKSKDVDIIVEPKSVEAAKNIVKMVYTHHDISNYHEVQFGRVFCCHGIDTRLKLGIHIDIIGSYISKGFEIFGFDELYEHTENYNGFRVLNRYFEAVMVFIYKQFNYKKPILKDEYKEIIFQAYSEYPEFRELISELVGSKLARKILVAIEYKNFDTMLEYSGELSMKLRRYVLRRKPIRTLILTSEFYRHKFSRLVLNYGKYSKVFAVMAPDGAGKTTFLDALMERIDYYYVNERSDQRCSLYHFRPNVLPNLGAIVEKTGIKEEDRDFTNPHRSKPANMVSSLFRIFYYWLDYLIGFNLKVRKDVQHDRFSVFDRYSYDFLVDPKRSRINLPISIRRFFVRFMPHPKVVFYLDASPSIIYERKQELTLDEIARQNKIYEDVASSNDRFITLDSSRPVSESVEDAMRIILNNFTKKL
jgi:thymidylate kinase